MSYNRGKEMELQINNKIAWQLSKKYSENLINNLDHKNLVDVSENIFGQYLSELNGKNIPYTENKTYITVWMTMLHTVKKNPKINICRGSIKLLHQTNTKRSN